MNYSVKVGRYIIDGPDWWSNFLRTYLSSIESIGAKDWESKLDECLKPYNAYYLSNVSSLPTLLFDSEKDAMFFMLKWA